MVCKLGSLLQSFLKSAQKLHRIIGNLTQKEWQELISLGLEEAKYLAKNLDDSKAKCFIEAMETIAKYGMVCRKYTE